MAGGVILRPFSLEDVLKVLARRNNLIADPAHAKKVSDLMLEYGAKLDALLGELQPHLSEEEFNRYRRATGRVMGEMLLEVMNPLYAAHPELKPPELI
jgi:hypothetical protein